MIVLGIVVSEVLYLSHTISLPISHRIIEGGHEYLSPILISLGILLLLFYLVKRDFFKRSIIILKSGRWELLIPIAFGIIISVSFGGVGTKIYSAIASSLNIFQLIIFTSLPFIVVLLILLSGLNEYIWHYKRGNQTAPFFISDEEKEELEDDQLGYSKLSEKFADRILNRGSVDSLVFGIDAPWGVGKSTFINFCIQYWKKSENTQPIIYKFNPIRYEDKNKLIEKFVDGLIRSIQKEIFLPEIKPLLSRYTYLFRKTKATFSFFGINVELFSSGYTADDALEDLKLVLNGFNRKIIIIVDDLDRLNFSTIKDVLFAINKSFALPNISYVLCYDTANINALEKEKPEIEKISEFFEKFVNIKINLYIDSDKLKNFISESQISLQSHNPQVDPLLVGQAMGGLKDIFNSNEYYNYSPFIGDIRKLKRLMNTVMLLEIEKTDFKNSDFNKEDLAHLLLLYINYPNIFRKVYYTETQGRRGFFSAVTPFDMADYPKENGRSPFDEKEFKNSIKYTEYIKSLSSIEQRFLLNKIFNVAARLPSGARIDGITEEIKKSYACFNGSPFSGSGNNLEEYLNLIVNQSKPQKEIQYRFYLNKINEIKQGTPIDRILAEQEFAIEKGEMCQEHLWRAILNSLYEFNGETGRQLITYVLTNIHHYSFFTNKKIGVGFRDDLSLYLVKMLDTDGWVDQNGGHRRNDNNNIKEIAEWVFGEGRHANDGVIQTLSSEDRGVLGLYDLLCFRLFCSADRGGDIFNVSRAIALHGDPKAPTDGPTKDIAVEEMREISQKVFQIFNKQYIDTNTNILKQIDELKLSDITGRYDSLIQTKIQAGEIEDVDATVGRHITQIKSFTVYQLGNSEIFSGIGCGYYDPEGQDDDQGIKKLINDYLFNICFNPSFDSENYKRFLDYLLIHFANVSERDGHGYIPHINEFTKVLIKERLAQYWTNNNIAIKELNLTQQDKKIYQANYVANYNTDLQLVFNELDKLLV
jgi:hypothetical protein